MNSQPIQCPELDEVIRKIVEVCKPSAIICFGQRIATQKGQSCFTNFFQEQHQYDLLVVGSSEWKKEAHHVDKIKNFNSETLQLNPLVHSERALKDSIGKGHPFFIKILQEGIFIFKSPQCGLVIDDQPLPLSISNEMEAIQMSFKLADEFLTAACDALGNEAFATGIFLLHQAVEQMCIASIKAHMGYKATTHNLTRLLALVSCYIPQAADIFPKSSLEEIEMYDFLKRAYSDVRYKPLYRVPDHIAHSIMVRVEELNALIKGHFNESFQIEEEVITLSPEIH